MTTATLIVNESKFYEMEATCFNCGTTDVVQIIKGRKPPAHRCSYCGCGGFTWNFKWEKPEGDDA